MPKVKQWYRKRRVADRYDVNERTIDRMAEDGRISTAEVSARFSLSDVGGR